MATKKTKKWVMRKTTNKYNKGRWIKSKKYGQSATNKNDDKKQ